MSIELSKLSGILSEHKLNAEQSEELQKLIYGIDDGKILEITDFPCIGDLGYIIFSAPDGYSRLLTVSYEGCMKQYISRESAKPDKFFIFVDAGSSAAKKEMSEWTIEEMDESYHFNVKEIGEKFFFDKAKALKVYHSYCNLSIKHLSIAKRCIGFNLKEVDENKDFIIKKNFTIVKQSEPDAKEWLTLFKIGFAELTMGENDMALSLSPLGIEWLSVFTNTNIHKV